MKNLLLIVLFFTASIGFSQENVDVKGNTVTIRETAPVWPGCENSKDQKACFNQHLMEHIKNNYKYPRDKDGKFIRGKATISMDIDENGKVDIKSIEADKPEVKAAAREMILKIPKMTPGRRGGKAAAIGYKIPLNL
ncbi:MAG: energy transducer TonB [Salegentibacter sp.]